MLASLRAVNGITVNTVHGNDDSIARVTRRFSPDVESMEGAAFMYACLIHGVPFAQVRAVSNIVERRNRAAWKLAEAIANLGDRRPTDSGAHDADSWLLALPERLLHVRCDGASAASISKGSTSTCAWPTSRR